MEDSSCSFDVSTQTTPPKSSVRFRYVGDIKVDENYSPNTRKRALLMMMNEIEVLRKKRKHFNRVTSTKTRAAESLQTALMSFKNSGQISNQTSTKLDVRFWVFFIIQQSYGFNHIIHI